ncbi:CAP domain-containing protein [Streptomyces seoulensis]
MGKHRKKQYYRRIAIAAVAVGAVGIPSVALACGDWPGGGTDQAAPSGSPLADRQSAAAWWAQAAWHRPSGESAGATPTAPASLTVPTSPAWAGVTAPPSAPASAPAAAVQPPNTAAGTPSATASKTKAAATAHQKHKSQKSHQKQSAAAKPRASVSPSTPKPTAKPTAEPTATASAPAAATTAPSVPTVPAATTAAPSSPAAQAPASGDAARVVQLVNAERAKVGCSPLTLNATLTKAAQAHSDDMAAHQNMSHTGSDGSAPGDRITGAGYIWSSYGENVAYGYATPEAVMAGWMASPGHKANILNCSFKEIGVGLAQPGSYWTQDFGTAR